VRRYLAIAGAAACLASLVAVASAAPRADTKYAGSTSQGNRASLWTDADGTAVRAFSIRREFKCGAQTAAGVFRQSSGIMVVRPTGRFWGHDDVRPSRGGEISRGEFTIRGKFGRRGNVVRGTYRERVRLKDGSRCDTGVIRYRVKARN